MSNWKPLDLRTCVPKPNQLVALRLVQSDDGSTLYNRDTYDIGMFATDKRSNSKKLWWHGTHGVHDPVKMKKRYTICWCEISEF